MSMAQAQRRPSTRLPHRGDAVRLRRPRQWPSVDQWKPVTASTPAVLLLSPLLVRHLVVATVRHCRVLRADGIPIPPELSQLVDLLAVVSGPQRTNLGRVDTPAEAVAVSFRQASSRLGVSERTVRRMCGSGRLPVVEIGRRRLVPVAAINSLLAGAA
jgi:excisionase family DNA binding protein